MARLIQIFEHERLTLTANERGEKLTPSELDKLYEFNDRHNNEYFTGIRDGVKFTEYVGVIQIGGLTIEILPKADKKQRNEPRDYDIWRNALLSMLAMCRQIKVESVSQASLNKRYHSLLDLYYEIYLDEVNALIHKGLIKQYRTHSANTRVLKGRIEFAENIKKNLIHQERFFTTHQVYDHQHTINQILLKGLDILSKIVTNPTIKDRICRTKLDFPDIKPTVITKAHFDKLKQSRKTIAYNEALKIAKMIILNYAPDIKNGQENMLALLFDMNKLWEEYVYRMLLRAQDNQYQIEFQNSQKFWEHKTIRPDIVVTKTEGANVEKFVIDTKWKIIDYRNPSDDDLKQMYAYNLYWDSGKCMLLYPKTEDFPESFGIFHKGRENGNACKLGFIEVLNGNGILDHEIGSVILNKLN